MCISELLGYNRIIHVPHDIPCWLPIPGQLADISLICLNSWPT